MSGLQEAGNPSMVLVLQGTISRSLSAVARLCVALSGRRVWGLWTTLYYYLRRWRLDDTWEQIYTHLRQLPRWTR